MADAFVAAPGAGCAPRKGDVLVVPAVAIGNVGQLACDLVLNSLLMSGADVERVGFIRSRNVLPMVGNDPLGVEAAGSVCINLEVFRVHSKGICVLQVRAPIAEGRMAAFAAELASWASAVGFGLVVMAGGADAATGLDEEVMTAKLRFAATTHLPTELAGKIEAGGLQRLRTDAARVAAAAGSSAASVDSLAVKLGSVVDLDLDGSDFDPLPQPASLLPVGKAGLLNPSLEAFERAGVPMVGLILFCKEGNNTSEAGLMTAVLNRVVPLLPEPLQLMAPRSWAYLDGPRPEVSLFQ